MSAKKKTYLVFSAALGLGIGWWSSPGRAEERFDHLVRNDFFAGFLGDPAALERGMKACEKVLAANPKHAEAMVWHGAGLFFLAGREFQAGNRDKGLELSQKGLAEMDSAVALAPDNIGVRIPRGASLLAAARIMGDSPFRRSLFERAAADHQRAFDLQKERLDQMGTHPKGELLFALGDVYSRMGEPEKAQKYFELIVDKLNDTPYGKRARTWMETRQPLPPAQTNCIGCHTGN